MKEGAACVGAAAKKLTAVENDMLCIWLAKLQPASIH